MKKSLQLARNDSIRLLIALDQKEKEDISNGCKVNISKSLPRRRSLRRIVVGDFRRPKMKYID